VSSIGRDSNGVVELTTAGEQQGSFEFYAQARVIGDDSHRNRPTLVR
jgi:hypothetical protein